jgi:plastocyanin
MRARVLTVGAVAVAATAAGTAGVASSRPTFKTAAARTVGVTVGDNFFRPARLSVRTGTRVRWRWRGQDRHNVTAVSGPQRFSSRTQQTGSFTRTLRRRGRYRIVCTLHGQSMQIRVR